MYYISIAVSIFYLFLYFCLIYLLISWHIYNCGSTIDQAYVLYRCFFEHLV